MQVFVDAPAFNVYGFEFRIESEATGPREALASDFAFFRAPQTTAPAVIEIFDRDADYGNVPRSPATIYTPRNVAYRAGQLTYLDYGGRALGIHDRASGGFRLYTPDPDLQYEAVYLFLLSRIAEFLDQRGLHRVHALAVSLHGRAILVLLPMGGGKSTLGARLLRHAEVKFLSDDSPFIDRKGRVHAFPLRLGLTPEAAAEIPPHQRRTIRRMEFGPKIAVQYDYYAAQVIPFAEPGIVFLGERSLAADCRIAAAGFGAGMRAMMANCVVGLGLFQGMEFVFRSSPWEIAAKAGTAFSRMRNSAALLRRSAVHRLVLGRDHDRNAETVLEFAERTLGGR